LRRFFFSQILRRQAVPGSEIGSSALNLEKLTSGAIWIFCIWKRVWNAGRRR